MLDGVLDSLSVVGHDRRLNTYTSNTHSSSSRGVQKSKGPGPSSSLRVHLIRVRSPSLLVLSPLSTQVCTVLSVDKCRVVGLILCTVSGFSYCTL